MNYEKLIMELLSQYMTDDGFKFWQALYKKIPPAWQKLSSSTGKYHQKQDGYVPTIAEHTYEMLYSTIKIYAMFGLKLKTRQFDLLLLGITLHDSVKYGNDNDKEHTDYTHDKLIADRIEKFRNTFLNIFTDDQVNILIEMTRFHSGRWSTDVGKQNINNFDFKDYHVYTMFIHTLDMLSSRDCLKTGSVI